MNISGICINGDCAHFAGSLERLEEDLTYFQECGFDGVEISVDGLDAVIGGRLERSRLDRIRTITERFDFLYTVHSPGRMNLAFPPQEPGGVPDLALEKAVFAANLECCAVIGAGVMVYHSGLIALHEVAHGLRPLPDEEMLEAARLSEVSALSELLPLAAEYGVVVAMENRDPHPWEIATLLRSGRSPDHLLTFHSGLSIPHLVRQVNEVNHPNLGLTLDLGHLILAANVCGFDYLEAIRQAAPHVRHIHGHDNFGRLGSVFDDLHARIPYGDGDLHLPLGWGTIPHLDSLAQLVDYEGLYVLEIRPRFRGHFADTLRTTRNLVQEVQDGIRS
ncbi:MAG: sugar phosphate isomerase/epimerase [Anaerolineae bacterium]|jgi:sugar phosphate isomerase/epimerase